MLDPNLFLFWKSAWRSVCIQHLCRQHKQKKVAEDLQLLLLVTEDKHFHGDSKSRAVVLHTVVHLQICVLICLQTGVCIRLVVNEGPWPHCHVPALAVRGQCVCLYAWDICFMLFSENLAGKVIKILFPDPLLIVSLKLSLCYQHEKALYS